MQTLEGGQHHQADGEAAGAVEVPRAWARQNVLARHDELGAAVEGHPLQAACALEARHASDAGAQSEVERGQGRARDSPSTWTRRQHMSSTRAAIDGREVVQSGTRRRRSTIDRQ